MSLTHYREISEKTSIENERLKNTSAIDPIFSRLSVPLAQDFFRPYCKNETRVQQIKYI